ncbi:DUF3824 domain-containing protein [Aspergillus lucknowensis]|uniref:DUF3824 domain-containing protein n=1 Tax=Aspergillus lucknowensis TaxID=176173 RepID=A0ABR4M6T0_9EURO
MSSSYLYRERDREDDWDEPRSGVSVKRYVIPPEDRDERELVIRRTTEREEPIMVQRYERETDYDRSERDYYEREYTVSDRPRRSPNPVVIREDQPVIIQEARGPVYINPRESDYEMIHRSEVDREPAYYYHRRVREYDNDNRRFRRELSPSDSVSQATRRRDDQEYSSDDSMVYIRKETKEYDGHHRRHLASGALVGVGAAEFLRSRRKKEGEEVTGGLGRIGRDVGAGALGAVAVEAASRAKKYYRSKSRHRSHSFDDDRSSRYSHHRHYSHSHSRHGRSRSRSHSRSRARTFAEIGLGAAAIAGAVALARKKSDSGRRSRSRHRRGVSSSRSAKDADEDKRSRSRRRKHMAEAGLAGAAVAGLVERARSRSRRRSRSRSKSKVRKALPVVAAGLGSAVAANVWDKRKEKKEAEEEPRRKDRHRSRSRGRPPSDIYPDPSRDSTGLIEYGDHPVTGSIPAANYYGRPASSQGYRTDGSEPVGRGATGHRGRTRSRSRARFGSSSPDSSGDDRRRRRSRHKHRSRSRDLAGAALAATGVGYAAHKYSQHRERERENRDRQQFDNDGRSNAYGEPYSPGPYPPSPGEGPPLDGSQFRPSNYYPPPPGSSPAPPVAPGPYNPSDYPPPPNAPPPPRQYSYPPGTDAYAPRPRRTDENVSAARNFSPPTAHYRPHDGLKDPSRLSTPRPQHGRSRAGSEPPQSKSVAFDVNTQHNQQKDGYETDDSDTTIEAIDSDRHRRHRRRRRRSDRRSHSSSEPNRSKRDPRKDDSIARESGLESDSDATIDLPDRFDREGRLLPQPGDDPLAERFENFMKRVDRIFV